MIPLLYEDDYMAAFDKPAGLVVTKAESVKAETVEQMLSGIAPYSSLERSGIVHRLDKDTSGVLLVAKTPLFKQQLHDLFEQRMVQKSYLALVHGNILHQTATIDAPIMRNPKNREKFTVGPEGREAQSQIQVLERYSLPIFEILSSRDHFTKKERVYYEQHAKDYTYVQVMPKSGRTHQIRVHMQYIHHPLVSDAVYLNRKLLRADTVWCPRHFLHAATIAFVHPVTGLEIKVECQLPDELVQAKSYLLPA